MILGITFYIVIAVLICILTVYVYIKNTDRDTRSIRTLLASAVFVPCIAVWLCSSLSKNYMVVEDSLSDTSGLNNTTYEVYGHPRITLSDGTVITTRGLGLLMSKNVVFNSSSRNLLVYPVVYGNTQGTPISFKRAENKKTPDPVYIPSGCYDKVKKTPDYWFVTPPSSIEESEGLLESLWHEIVGAAKVKWCIIEYDYEPESD